MNPLLFMKAKSSLKTQAIIACSIIVGLFFMPLIVLASVGSLSAFVSPGNQLYDGPVVTSDNYSYGYCTYWAALRRIQIGHPIPNTWGNANTWGIRAAADNYTVDHDPSYGAVMQTNAGPLGHVAFVESVNPTSGSWTISEMNAVGWDVVDSRTLPATMDLFYNFIH